MSPSPLHLYRIAGIGELLWDFLPGSQRLGGAPANFSYHCHQLGATAYPVSSLGEDLLGIAAFNALSERGTNLDFVEKLEGRTTGRVNLSLDGERKPTFEIKPDAAWDHLHFSPKLKQLAGKLDAACFGTLAQRFATTRNTIQSFIRSMPATSLKILDINLRSPFYSKALIEDSLNLATILKLSDDELFVLAAFFNLRGSTREQLTTLLNRFDLKLIALTCGSKGSILIDAEQYDECPAPPTELIDSVGAGDSFAAALCLGLLQHQPLSEINLFANRIAAFVCSRDGATPTLPSFALELETA
ncbi:MAG: carbohydrate kinase [Verrucomicrobiales bacterium]|nr:carbohydrate kinase [Verrucomicrobiales bacterium]